jgi:hypothetical protein
MAVQVTGQSSYSLPNLGTLRLWATYETTNNRVLQIFVDPGSADFPAFIDAFERDGSIPGRIARRIVQRYAVAAADSDVLIFDLPANRYTMVNDGEGNLTLPFNLEAAT